MPLMIVESPNKIKKIKKALPSNFVVMASVGHIMDLKKKGGIDLDTWDVEYDISPDKKDVVKGIKEEAKKHEVIYIATDPDREGYAIGEMIRMILPKNKKVERVVFNKLTKPAIQAAIKNPVGFDSNIYDAQKARRITDRLIGFKVSPVMWSKGLKNTSAGRVQSATLKWLVDREREIRNFKVEEYWSIEAVLEDFSAMYYGKKGKKYVPKTKEAADKVIKESGKDFVVTSYDAKERKRSPAPPFNTASLQKDASTKFGWSSKRTMDVAQALFSSGNISYHRSDSLRVDVSKVNDIRDKIEQNLGNKFLSPKARVYKNKDASQDAHEAIHPTFEPVPATISVDEKRLLDLITNRFMASQMADAIFDQTKIELTAGDHIYKASGSVLKEQGFLRVYGSSSKDVALPKLQKGDSFKASKFNPNQHFTKPPARYSDAAFTNKMEVENVGRPSTYASVPETLLRHKYITREKKALKPTEVGMMVSDYLSEFFKDVTHASYTAKLESELDNIASGSLNMKDTMDNFWSLLSAELDSAKKGNLGDLFTEDIDCPSCKDGTKMVRKLSKNKEVFLGCTNYPKCGLTMNFNENGELEHTHVETSEPCPKCGGKISQKKSRFGKFWACESSACKWTASVGENGEIIEKKKAEVTEHKCPKCESPMVKRSSRNGEFLGCSAYPKCKSTANLDEDGNMVVSKKRKTKKPAKDTGKVCPKCKKNNLVEREGRYGTFISCSGYPKCKYIHKE